MNEESFMRIYCPKMKGHHGCVINVYILIESLKISLDARLAVGGEVGREGVSPAGEEAVRCHIRRQPAYEWSYTTTGPKHIYVQYILQYENEAIMLYIHQVMTL